ncbi:zinc finger BED domain-containing protein 4-like [Amblyomma americanum]
MLQRQTSDAVGHNSAFLTESGKRTSFGSVSQPSIKCKFDTAKVLSQKSRCGLLGCWHSTCSHTTIESRGFKELMHDMQPLYKVPSRTTFSRTITPDLHRDTVIAVKHRIHADLQEGVQSLSFTSDMWTSRSNQSYVSLACHYLTSKFEFQAFTLGNQHMIDSRTACNILAHLEAMTSEWDLPLQEVPIFVVTDNARNFRAALRDFQCAPMQCLQLAIKDAKEETAGVPAILKKCRAIVGHYMHSAQAAARLKDCQRRMELPLLELVQNVDNRWNSEHDMLSRLFQLKEAVCLELATSETVVSNPTPQEWKTVTGLVKAIEPITSATEDLSGQKYASLSSVIPFLYETHMVLKDCAAADDDMSLFTKKLQKSVQARFPNHNEQKEYTMKMACDPRFKNIFCTEALQETRLLELAWNQLQSLSIPPPTGCAEPSTYTAQKQCSASIWDNIDQLAMSSGKRQP